MRFEIYGSLREEIGMETYLHGSMDYTETAFSCRAVFSCRGPGPARKKRYTSSRGEEEEDAQMCLCGKKQ